MVTQILSGYPNFRICENQMSGSGDGANLNPQIPRDLATVNNCKTAVAGENAQSGIHYADADSFQSCWQFTEKKLTTGGVTRRREADRPG